MKFYIDTAIWLDFLEDRKGYLGEPIGKYAGELFKNILFNKDTIIVSTLLINELKIKCSFGQINSMFKPFEKRMYIVRYTFEQSLEARKLVVERDLPKGDALHAILARDEKAILIARDNHFKKLRDICQYYKPENFII